MFSFGNDEIVLNKDMDFNSQTTNETLFYKGIVKPFGLLSFFNNIKLVVIQMKEPTRQPQNKSII